MADPVTLYEVGPRDGLQNEKAQIATADKVRLVDLLSAACFRKIEVTSFVSPRWVPQMADAAEVMAGIHRANGVTYAVLTPNLRGFESALAAGADEVAIFASASEGFSMANLNCTIAESLERFAPVAAAAKDAGVPLRGYVSCVTDCPFDGPTPPASVARVTAALRDLGACEVSLGDTIGAGTPETVGAMLNAVMQELPPGHLAGHFHDTGGRALENIEVCLAAGLRTFDSAVGGLGGCPYAPGAEGNVATEAVADLMDRLGHPTGIDRARLSEAADFARTLRSPR
ncbi:hydroxymethylglutaryl-CoA lyase [Wenxinia marina]|uniref:Isopropylmalate/homocitrate/citramalate synthase n=1 Tax=Wenxinia marina DSM 24838 TaxID=1123501 RepID=A0A0D0QG74_9RHOB|nr:hydroxymethylglutaryl-CoA lyase [Wenxinia marina]KIQ71247.1 Isopropylmalate/homocitrate/citramalate synthase [Wenxinia marina DSM 24838]GGL73132.1 hydroxymethylglutaryl-CoA lyase [Wenxinia marina]